MNGIIDFIVSHFILINLYLAIEAVAFTYYHYVHGRVNITLSYISPAMLSVPTFGMIVDPERYDVYLVCLGMMGMGCLYKFGRLLGKNELSWKAVLMQFMITIPLSVVSYATWFHMKSSWPIHILLFFVGAFSTVIANIFDKVSEMGIKQAFSRGLRYLSAKIDEGDKHDGDVNI